MPPSIASVRVVMREDGVRAVGFMPGMRAFTTDKAERYAAKFKQWTPIGQTGRVRRAIRVLVSGADRVSVYTDVMASWSFWHFVEFGSINQEPTGAASGAAAELGLRWEDPGPNAPEHR